MSEWRETTLGDVLTVHHGFAFRGEHFDDHGSDVLLTPKNFRAEGGLDVRAGRCKRYAGPVESRYVLGAGDVVVAMTDLKQDAPILGSAGRVPDGGRYLHNQRIGKVEVTDYASLCAAFVPWLLNSHAVRSAVRETATGATVRHTAPSRIEAAVALLPSPEVQQRIAALLDAFDHLIAIHDRHIEVLEELVRALYRDRFGRPVPDDGAETVTIADVAETVSGSTNPSKRPGTIFELFSIPAYDSGLLPAVASGESIKSNKTRLDSNCVLVSKLNPRIPRTWFAVPRSENAVASTEFLAWRGRSVSNEWLWGTFGGDRFRSRMASAAGGTSTSHQRMKSSDVAEFSFRRPTADALRVFDDFAAPALRSADERRRASVALARTRDLLLPRLVSGRLDISDVDLGSLLPEEIAA